MALTPTPCDKAARSGPPPVSLGEVLRNTFSAEVGPRHTAFVMNSRGWDGLCNEEEWGGVPHSLRLYRKGWVPTALSGEAGAPGNTPPVAILNGARTSRSEAPAESKDPCTLRSAKTRQGILPAGVAHSLRLYRKGWVPTAPKPVEAGAPGTPSFLSRSPSKYIFGRGRRTRHTAFVMNSRGWDGLCNEEEWGGVPVIFQHVVPNK